MPNVGPTELVICLSLLLIIVIGVGAVVISRVASQRITETSLSSAQNKEFKSISNTDPTRGEADFRAELRQRLTDHFSEDELRTLCFDMGLDYEDLTGEGKTGKARELVALVERQNNMARLIAQCRLLRPNVQWEDHPGVL